MNSVRIPPLQPSFHIQSQSVDDELSRSRGCRVKQHQITHRSRALINLCS